MAKRDYNKISQDIGKLIELVNCQDGIKAPRCEYFALGERCTFAGTISPQIHAGGEWYCRFHYSQLQGHLTEEEAAMKVRESYRDVSRHKNLGQNWRASVIEQKTISLRESGDEMMVYADKLASGKGGKEDKAEFLGFMRKRLKGIVSKTNAAPDANSL